MTTSATHPVGTPTPRADGLGKVTGAARYTADVGLPGALWAKSLRSPLPHARIVRIDTSRARALPGVRAVLTSDDVSTVLSGRKVQDLPVLAQGVVRFVGEQVAAVAADDEETAERAAGLIEVEYEELPAVFDAAEAMRPGAVLVHPGMHIYGGLPKPLEGPSNVFVRNEWGKGDPEAGLAAADVIVENTFTTSMVHQAYIEPNSWLVWADEEGRAQVWASNKTPHPAKRQVAGPMGLDPEQVRLNPVTIGGDFGGKGQPRNIPLCYYLSLATGRPIRMVFEYTEEFLATNPRHPATMRLRTGAMRDGTIVAHEAELVFNSGAFAGFIPQGFVPGASGAGGPYHIPNTRIVASHVYTNNVPRGFMRGPGRQQSAFAIESQMDCVARAIGMDPAELRRRNLVRDGDETAIGERFLEIKAPETLEAAIAASDFDKPRPVGAVLRGRGIALTHQEASGGETHAIVALNPDGSVVLSTPIFEQGAGTYTILQQVVAERLGLPADRVTVRVLDTDGFAFDSGMAAQRGARVGTQAAHGAAEQAERNLAKLASDLLGWPAERISLNGDRVVRADTGQSEPWAALVGRTGAPVTGEADVDDNTHAAVTAFTAQVAGVSVDPETGEVSLLKLTTAHDTGRILNPQGHQGQINGAAMQGVGYGLMEEMPSSEGRVTTLSFADYKIPTIADVPELRTVLLESESGLGPLAVKGIGENASAPTAAAIANAVEDACGIRIRDLPVTAERLYQALRAREAAR